MGRKVKVDFSNVHAYKRCEEGIHVAKLVAIDEGTTQGGDDMLKATFEVIQGESKDARVYENFTLTEKALWKLKMFLVATGQKSEGKLVIDLDKLIGKVVNIEVAHEEYGGQLRAKILSYSSVNSTDDAEEEEWEEEEEPKKEEPPKKSKKKEEPKKAEPKKEEIEDDDDWEDDEDWEET